MTTQKCAPGKQVQGHPSRIGGTIPDPTFSPAPIASSIYAARGKAVLGAIRAGDEGLAR